MDYEKQLNTLEIITEKITKLSTELKNLEARKASIESGILSNVCEENELSISDVVTIVRNQRGDKEKAAEKTLTDSDKTETKPINTVQQTAR